MYVCAVRVIHVLSALLSCSIYKHVTVVTSLLQGSVSDANLYATMLCQYVTRENIKAVFVDRAVVVSIKRLNHIIVILAIYSGACSLDALHVGFLWSC